MLCMGGSGAGGNKASLWGLEKVICGLGLQLSDIVKILQITSSKRLQLYV